MKKSFLLPILALNACFASDGQNSLLEDDGAAVGRSMSPKLDNPCSQIAEDFNVLNFNQLQAQLTGVDKKILGEIPLDKRTMPFITTYKQFFPGISPKDTRKAIDALIFPR